MYDDQPKHDPDCVFCLMILNNEYMAISRTHDCVVIKPRDPVVLGHILVVPQRHSKDATEDTYGVAMAMKFAFELVQDEGYDANIITSIGPEATQTVFHTHIHVVPRKAGDGLRLPWTGQKKEQHVEVYGGDPEDHASVHGGDPGPDGSSVRQAYEDYKRQDREAQQKKLSNGLTINMLDDSGHHIQSSDPGIAGSAMMRQRMIERQRHSLVYDDDRINWRG